MATRRPILLLVPALALLLSPAPPAWAQAIQGVILDDVSGLPISSVVVDLVNASDSIVGQDVTGEDGRFVIQVPDGETYQLRSGRLGYLLTMSTPFAVVPGKTARAEIRLEVDPVSLAPIEAVVEGGKMPGLDRVGFYTRQRLGFGHVRTPEDLEDRPPLDLGDLFRGINGIRLVQPAGSGDWDIISARRLWGTECRPSISIDHVIVQRGRRRMPLLGVDASDLEVAVGGRDVNRSHWQDLVTVQEVAAIEVYPGQGGMPGWVSGDVSPCGAILLWTKGYAETM